MLGTWMEDDLCWCSFFLWFGAGGRTCSNFLASTLVIPIPRGSNVVPFWVVCSNPYEGHRS